MQRNRYRSRIFGKNIYKDKKLEFTMFLLLIDYLTVYLNMFYCHWQSYGRVCLLHYVETHLYHHFETVDGVTLGAGEFLILRIVVT